MLRLKTKGILVIGYDLILAFGAFAIGILMIQAKQGLFSEFPQEWVQLLPFDSWLIPGIIAISLFGVGNLVSAALCIWNKTNIAWAMSMVMGLILLLSMIAQIIVLGEWYLATLQLIIAALLQLLLSGCACYRNIQHDKKPVQ